MRLKTAIFLLLTCMSRLWAQEFTYVDWNILRPDTLPVQYTEVIPLDEDYRGSATKSVWIILNMSV